MYVDACVYSARRATGPPRFGSLSRRRAPRRPVAVEADDRTTIGHPFGVLIWEGQSTRAHFRGIRAGREFSGAIDWMTSRKLAQSQGAFQATRARTGTTNSTIIFGARE